MFTDQTKAAPDANPKAPGAPSPEQLEHLLVLSQAPLSLDEALAQEAAEDAAPTEPQPMTVARLAIQYVQILAHFVGVGLVAAAVRHLSSDPTLYLGLGAAGVVLFAAAATTMDAGARRGGLRAIGSFAGASVLLGLGLGLFVGGILHFSAFPTTGAVLVPAGMVLSFAGHALRSGRELLGRGMLSPAITMIGIVVWVGIGLGVAAKKLDPAPLAAQGAHGETAAGGHSDAAHGEAAADGAHGEAAGDASHGEVAASDHGESAAKDEAAHGDAAAGHGETTADHGDAAAKADAGHDGAAATSHGETAAKAKDDAAHGDAAAAHGEAAADHGDAGH